MKALMLTIALTISAAASAQNLSSKRSIKRKAVECTTHAMKWMYRKSQSTNRNLVVFSTDFDEQFLARQKAAGNKNLGLRGANRERKQKMFLVEMTNLLLDKQKPFMRDCIRLHYMAEKNCQVDEVSGEINLACSRRYINPLNLAAIREKNRI